MQTKAVNKTKQNTASKTKVAKKEEQKSSLIFTVIRKYPIDITLIGVIFILFIASLISSKGMGYTIDGVASINTTLSLDILYHNNISAAFAHVGILGVMAYLLTKWWGVTMNGAAFMGILMAIAFGFLGKSIIAFPFAVLGNVIMSKVHKRNFAGYFIPTIFALSLSPVFTLLWTSDVFLGELFAIAAIMSFSILLNSISQLTSRMHEGYTLANGAAAAGIMSFIANGILLAIGVGERGSGFDFATNGWENVFTGGALLLFSAFALWFLLMAILVADYKGKFFKFQLQETGKLPTDFAKIYGFSESMLNTVMLIVFMLSGLLIFDINANAYVIAALFQVIAFGAFGKTPRSVFIVFTSAFVTWFISKEIGLDVNNYSIDIAFAIALYASLLAPVIGLGVFPLVLASAMHMSLLPIITGAHGSLLLYNNGMTALFSTTVVLGISKSVNVKWLFKRVGDQVTTSREKLISMNVASEIIFYMINSGAKSPSVEYHFKEKMSEIIFTSHIKDKDVFIDICKKVNIIKRDYVYETEYWAVLGKNPSVTNIELLGKVIDHAFEMKDDEKNYVMVIKRLL